VTGKLRAVNARLPALVLLVLACALSACGSGGPTRTADTEGIYLELGPLKYQIQLSRQLNPSDPEDASYLRGLTAADRRVTPGQAFFAVWLRVENPTASLQQPAQSFQIADTQGKVYTPLYPDSTNVFAYRSVGVPAHSRIPLPGSPAESSPTQGAVLLFKVDAASYDNRPLVLTVANPANGEKGRADLDV